MKISNAEIADVKVIEPKVFHDERGYFYESWNQRVFNELIGVKEFVQDNQSKSSQGTLRGLHYQREKPQGKLVRVIKGKVFDVAVDIRRDSPTFGKWVGEILSSENMRQLWVPEGFAHGFYVLSDTAEFSYKCTNYYYREYEEVILWDDSNIAIEWPILKDKEILLSDKDRNGVSLQDSKEIILA